MDVIYAYEHGGRNPEAVVESRVILRRSKTISVNPQTIFDLLTLTTDEFTPFAMLDDVPADAMIGSVWFCQERVCFRFRVYHDSFPETEEGCVPEESFSRMIHVFDRSKAVERKVFGDIEAAMKAIRSNREPGERLQLASDALSKWCKENDR